MPDDSGDGHRDPTIAEEIAETFEEEATAEVRRLATSEAGAPPQHVERAVTPSAVDELLIAYLLDLETYVPEQ